MSSTRLQHPGTSRTQRSRGGARGGGSFNPQPINRPQGRGSQHSERGEREGGDESMDHQDEGGPGGGGGGRGGGGGPQNGRGSAHTGERNMKSQGTHYVLPPDPSKNAKLKQTAEQEEERWRQHKEEKRERIAHELSQQRPEAVGGASYSREELAKKRREQERKQQVEAKYAAIRRKQKSEEFRQETRRREEEEIQRMRQSQREKAKRLGEKKAVQDEMDRDQLRRNRLAYFESKQNT